MASAVKHLTDMLKYQYDNYYTVINTGQAPFASSDISLSSGCRLDSPPEGSTKKAGYGCPLTTTCLSLMVRALNTFI